MSGKVAKALRRIAEHNPNDDRKLMRDAKTGQIFLHQQDPRRYYKWLKNEYKSGRYKLVNI